MESYHYGLPKHINAMVQMLDTHEVVLVGHIYSTINSLPDDILSKQLDRRQMFRESRYVPSNEADGIQQVE